MSNKKTILVIGSSGYLGRQITSLLGTQRNVIKTHYKNRFHQDSIPYDFFNDNIGSLLDKHKVDVVILACTIETCSLDRLRTSMEKFAITCKKQRVIYVSSDGIYDGRKGLYSEKDSPNSQTLYGKNLAVCEKIIARHCNNYCIVRPSYLYGFSNGTLDARLTKTRDLLHSGTEVILYNDMYKSPIGVQQIAQSVIDFTGNTYTGLIHVAGQRLSVYEFHRQAMFALKVDTINLKSCQMPTDKGFSRDSSLNTSLWQRLTGSKAKSIKETLNQVPARQQLTSVSCPSRGCKLQSSLMISVA